jgi:hypothetical protein
MVKYKYKIIHHHKRGTDLYLFESARRFTDLPSTQILCEVLKIDYDENDDTEFLDIDCFFEIEPFNNLDDLLEKWRQKNGST